MNAHAIVQALLEVEDVLEVPEGYKLLDTAQAGDYILRLWQGNAHVNGEPVKFNEVSLNAAGRRFDKTAQATKYPGSIHALGHRQELLHTLAKWIKQYGELYIGSYEQDKVALYHRLLKRHLSRLSISDLYAPFDECEGKPEYFRVTAPSTVIESILAEAVDDVDPKRYVDGLPDVTTQAVDEASKMFARIVANGAVTQDNFGEMAESVVNEVVDKFNLTSGDELVDIKTFNTILQHLLTHVDQRWPGTDAG